MDSKQVLLWLILSVVVFAVYTVAYTPFHRDEALLLKLKHSFSWVHKRPLAVSAQGEATDATLAETAAAAAAAAELSVEVKASQAVDVEAAYDTHAEKPVETLVGIPWSPEPWHRSSNPASSCTFDTAECTWEFGHQYFQFELEENTQTEKKLELAEKTEGDKLTFDKATFLIIDGHGCTLKNHTHFVSEII